jgi:cysteine-rich repeat protein
MPKLFIFTHRCISDVEAGKKCGNGKLEPGEACDDGNVKSFDGCSSNCFVEQYFTCQHFPSVPDVCECKLGTKKIVTTMPSGPTLFFNQPRLANTSDKN